MIKSYNNRLFLLIGFLCFIFITLILIAQYFFEMKPCAWCILQRLIYIVIGCITLINLLFFKRKKTKLNFSALLIVILGSFGISSAWLQYNNSSESMTCDMTFAEKIIDITGLDIRIPWLFGIQALCTNSEFYLFGIEYPIWSLILFGLIIVLAILDFLKIDHVKINKV